jgi:hypothetical protein
MGQSNISVFCARMGPSDRKSRHRPGEDEAPRERKTGARESRASAKEGKASAREGKASAREGKASAREGKSPKKATMAERLAKMVAYTAYTQDQVSRKRLTHVISSSLKNHIIVMYGTKVSQCEQSFIKCEIALLEMRGDLGSATTQKNIPHMYFLHPGGGGAASGSEKGGSCVAVTDNLFLGIWSWDLLESRKITAHRIEDTEQVSIAVFITYMYTLMNYLLYS